MKSALIDSPGTASQARPRSVHTADPGTLLEDDRDGALWAEFLGATGPEAFCRAWLALQCRAIRGVNAALLVLAPKDGDPFSPVAAWPAPARASHLSPVATRALGERRGLVSRRDGPDAPGGHDVAYLLELDGHVHGAVALDLAERPDPELQAALRQLHWGAAWLEVLFRRDGGVRAAASRERLQSVLDLVAAAAGHERFHAAATAFVTAMASRLACDRVSLGFAEGGRVHVRAVSHSAQWSAQANLVRAIAAAMDEALDQCDVVVHPSSATGPARVTRAHAELARQHGTGAVCSIPVMAGAHVVGVLTLERAESAPFDAPAVELGEAVVALAGPLLEHHRRDDRWLGARVAESAREGVGALLGQGRLAAKLIAALATGAALLLAVVKIEYRVSAHTALEPSVRRAVVAPFNGYVAEAPARAGDVVRRAQPLANLDDRDLRLERLRLAGQREQLAKQSDQARAAHNKAQLRIAEAQVAQVDAQLALAQDQLARTRVVAPFDGVVVRGDLSQSLGAPVERGQILFEVAPLDAYRVILQVDERDIAEIAAGQRGRLLLTGFPGDALPFGVEKLTPVATARDGRNYFRVEARLDRPPDRLRPGLEGVARIDVGRRRLLWIWTHPVVDWLRLTLWSWRP